MRLLWAPNTRLAETMARAVPAAGQVLWVAGICRVVPAGLPPLALVAVGVCPAEEVGVEEGLLPLEDEPLPPLPHAVRRASRMQQNIGRSERATRCFIHILQASS